MNNKLKTKDILLVALLTAVYMIIYMVAMGIISFLGPFGNAISPGVCSIFSGTLIYFMANKVGKMWQFTIFTILVMGAFSLMGGAYLPWFITSIGAAVIADFICSRSNNPGPHKVAIASGIMHVGQAWGAIVPAVLFVESYRETWIKRGQTAEDMDAMIKYTAGAWAIYSTIIVFVLAVIGVYIGYFILKKHFENKN